MPSQPVRLYQGNGRLQNWKQKAVWHCIPNEKQCRQPQLQLYLVTKSCELGDYHLLCCICRKWCCCSTGSNGQKIHWRFPQHIPLCLTHVSIVFCSLAMAPPMLRLILGRTTSVDFFTFEPTFQWYSYSEAPCSTEITVSTHGKKHTLLIQFSFCFHMFTTWSKITQVYNVLQENWKGKLKANMNTHRHTHTNTKDTHTGCAGTLNPPRTHRTDTLETFVQPVTYGEFCDLFLHRVLQLFTHQKFLQLQRLADIHRAIRQHADGIQTYTCHARCWPKMPQNSHFSSKVFISGALFL